MAETSGAACMYHAPRGQLPNSMHDCSLTMYKLVQVQHLSRTLATLPPACTYAAIYFITQLGDIVESIALDILRQLTMHVHGPRIPGLHIIPGTFKAADLTDGLEVEHFPGYPFGRA